MVSLSSPSTVSPTAKTFMLLMPKAFLLCLMETLKSSLKPQLLWNMEPQNSITISNPLYTKHVCIYSVSITRFSADQRGNEMVSPRNKVEDST